MVSATTALAGELATVAVDSLNVRSGPGTSHAITYVLRQGATVEIIQRSGDWASIVGATGGEGWVYSPYLSVSSSGSTPSYETVEGNIIGSVDEFARDYLRKNGFTFIQTTEHTTSQVIEEWRRESDGLVIRVTIEQASATKNVIAVQRI